MTLCQIDKGFRICHVVVSTPRLILDQKCHPQKAPQSQDIQPDNLMFLNQTRLGVDRA